MPETTTDPVKIFLRKIGSKGGKKSAQHPNRRHLNKLAAEARWRKRLPTPSLPAYVMEEQLQRQRQEKARQSRQDWIAQNPVKRLAHQRIGTAIRRGKLERQPCEVCGNPKSHAHHDDHTKPLEVHWLCAKHHKEREKIL